MRGLVEALVVPFAHKLTSPTGASTSGSWSNWSGLFDLWDIEVAGGPTGAQQVFLHIEKSLDGLAAAVRHERVTLFLGLVTEALATRARQIESDRLPALDHDAFVQNLVDMAVGALAARDAAGVTRHPW